MTCCGATVSCKAGHAPDSSSLTLSDNLESESKAIYKHTGGLQVHAGRPRVSLCQMVPSWCRSRRSCLSPSPQRGRACSKSTSKRSAPKAHT